MAVKNILLTGPPQIGKTTIIEKLIRNFRDFTVCGFFTKEIRESGRRAGFSLNIIGGHPSVLAHVNFRSRYRVGSYKVDIEEFEQQLKKMNLTSSESRVIIIDEIGKMECFSEEFHRTVNALLETDKVIIATIAAKGVGFISEIKNRRDCRLINVTRENRDTLSDEIEKIVRGMS